MAVVHDLRIRRSVGLHPQIVCHAVNNTKAKHSSADKNGRRCSLSSAIWTHWCHPLNERNPLGTRLTDASLHDLYVALTACECLPKLQMRLITSLNADRGALPQALTPAVRREILNNPQLKILNSVPRPLDDIVGGIFADEQKFLRKSARDSLKN